jgi:hypothetical protein
MTEVDIRQRRIGPLRVPTTLGSDPARDISGALNTMVTPFATREILSALRWNTRRYAVLRASHNYLVADFFLTLLLHLCAALSHVRVAKSHVLNLGRLWFEPRRVFTSDD